MHKKISNKQSSMSRYCWSPISLFLVFFIRDYKISIHRNSIERKHIKIRQLNRSQEVFKWSCHSFKCELARTKSLQVYTISLLVYRKNACKHNSWWKEAKQKMSKNNNWQSHNKSPSKMFSVVYRIRSTNDLVLSKNRRANAMSWSP